jgi:4-amino-4-deoxy-L-arabinose transferase-like glycosyltransferase
MRQSFGRKLHAFLESRVAPAVFGALTAAVVLWIWGSLRANPLIHDEASYLLQAKTFAAGRWTMPSPPLPEFFDQFHVLVSPVVASKYPPGQSVVLATGVLAGLPGLPVVLLNAISGALIFALARKILDASTGAVTWLVWISAPDTIRFAPSYFSEVTTLAFLLGSWWALLRWRETGFRRWLTLMGFAFGWIAITRPLTALALAIPIGVFLMRGAHPLRSIALVSLVGAPILLLMPIQNHRTTGDARLPPYAVYNKQYAPHDKLGFRVDETRPTRELPADMQDFNRTLLDLHRRLTVARLPIIAGQRLLAVLSSTFGGWRWPFALAALIGVFRVPREGRFALVSAGLLFTAYLLHAHDPAWTLYSYEGEPALALCAAVGIVYIVRRVSRAVTMPSLRWAAGALGATFLILGFVDLVNARGDLAARGSEQRLFLDLVGRIPGRAIVFVRYTPGMFVHYSLIFNDPDFARSRVWLARDRGADDSRLEAAAPDRIPYLYDQQRHRLTRL